jgi:low temperature requirement protein LtrA
VTGPPSSTPAPRRSLRAEGDQGVTFVELFFDLVFVFAITQITKLVVDDLTFGGAAEAVLLLWMIWWAWTQFTWALNPADTTHPGVRLATLAGTVVAFLMAVAVPEAFGDTGLWFALSYVAVRALGLAIYFAAAAAETGQRRAVIVFGSRSAIAMVFAVAGGVVDSPLRWWLWLAAVALDLLAAIRGGREETWDLLPGHFAERHGLIVIIALGESLVVAGAGVTGQDVSGGLIGVALGSVVVTCLLWWLYFGWWQGAVEEKLRTSPPGEQGRFARDVYSLWHFPLIAGVIGTAVAIEEMVLHPGDPLPPVVRASLAAGLVLYLGATDLAWWRATGRLLPERTFAAVVLAVLVAVLEVAPGWELAVVAAGLLAVVAVERARGR